MKKRRAKTPGGAVLRRRAEAKLGVKRARGQDPIATDPARLVHELEVHQIELELQNEELRSVRDELEVSLARATELYDFAPVGYLTLDPRGVVCEANLRGASLLDRERGALLGTDFASLLSPETRPTLEAFLQTTLAGGGHRSCDVLVRRRGGGATPVQLEWMPEEEGAVAGRRCRMALLDVTELRKLEAYARRGGKMEAVALLAAGVAHEINNPLSYVLEGLGHLQEQLTAIVPARPDLLESARDCHEGVQRIREVVQSLRTLSSPARAPRSLVDLRKELEGALRLALNELRHRACVVTRLEPTPVVEASPHELGRVFLNLLVNAAQAIPEGAADRNTVKVSCGADGDGWAIVEVKDSGEGMAPEVLERAFEPFYSTKPQGVGMGLGLALAHGAVAAAGGRIEVTSSPGAGSTFRVRLPPAGARETARAPDGPVAAAPVASTGDGPGRKWRVLVVDDDQRVARSTARVLGVSCAVTVCTSGAEALDRLAGGEPFDAVLCDLMMPAMSGAQLHGRVAARWPALASRFVFLTGGAFTPEARDFLEQSRCARMEKPFEAATLRAVVERVASAGEGRAHRHGGELP